LSNTLIRRVTASLQRTSTPDNWISRGSGRVAAFCSKAGAPHIMGGMSSGHVPISVAQHTRQQLACKVQTRIPKHSTLTWIRAAAICSKAVRQVPRAACHSGTERTRSAQHTRQQLAYKVQARISLAFNSGTVSGCNLLKRQCA